MIGKIIAGTSFVGSVGYVMNRCRLKDGGGHRAESIVGEAGMDKTKRGKEQSRVLAAEGVTPPDIREMVQDFKDQTLLNPRLKNTVGHISLSFSSKDAPCMTDVLMTRIAKECMQRMGITDTQYLLVRHLDQPHPHCHLVYNRIDNNGQTISDKNIKIRNTKVCRTLTEKYGLHLAPEKKSVRREHLREPDKTKYEIYDAIKTSLPNCGNWNDLELRLKEHGIAMRYKYCGSTNQKQGVLFCKNGFEFSGSNACTFSRLGKVQASLTLRSAYRKGSKIDRQFSYSKLNRHFAQTQQRTQYQATLAKGFHAAVDNYRLAFTGLFGNTGGSGSKGQADNNAVNFGSNIGTLPLPPNDSPVGLSTAQLQRKPGESPEEHIARITALLNSVAEAMAIAAMEQKRKLRDRKANKPKIKL